MGWTQQHDDFRDEIRTWFAANSPERPIPPIYTEEGLAGLREWERRLTEGGYAAVSWPKEYGGMGADRWTQVIFDEEYFTAGLPQRLNRMGLSLAGPTIMACGTQEQKEKWIPGILSCEEIWCQGFSEPGAGSDLASLSTRGTVDGDELVISGTKVWTSMGPVATRMFALVRTDLEAPKHRGITWVVLDMDSPGISVSPLVQLHGERGFAEVMFDDVRVPLANVVGGLNNGWQVAMTTLGVERGTGEGRHARLSKSLDTMASMIRDSGANARNVERLGRTAAWSYAFEKSVHYIVGGMIAEKDVSAETSVMKLVWSELDHQLHEEILSVLGTEAEVVRTQGQHGELQGWQRDYWHSRASKIFAGTNQIQRNIIAERVLGLPKESRA